MIVKEWMSKKPMTLGTETSVLNAAEVMRTQKVRQFPVLSAQGTLAGIVSDRDIRDAFPSKFLPEAASAEGKNLMALTVGDIMTLDPITVSPQQAMDKVADILAKNKIGALPVVEKDLRLVGIITEVDVFKFLCSATGLARGGIQLAIRLQAKPGPLSDLLALLREQQVHFSSVLTSHDYEKAGYRHVYIRLESLGDYDIGSLVAFLDQDFEVLYYIQHDEAVSLGDAEDAE